MPSIYNRVGAGAPDGFLQYYILTSCMMQGGFSALYHPCKANGRRALFFVKSHAGKSAVSAPETTDFLHFPRQVSGARSP
jgi:hypothetical protein